MSPQAKNSGAEASLSNREKAAADGSSVAGACRKCRLTSLVSKMSLWRSPFLRTVKAPSVGAFPSHLQNWSMPRRCSCSRNRP